VTIFVTPYAKCCKGIFKLQHKVLRYICMAVIELREIVLHYCHELIAGWCRVGRVSLSLKFGFATSVNPVRRPSYSSRSYKSSTSVTPDF